MENMSLGFALRDASRFDSPLRWAAQGCEPIHCFIKIRGQSGLLAGS